MHTQYVHVYSPPLFSFIHSHANGHKKPTLMNLIAALTYKCTHEEKTGMCRFLKKKKNDLVIHSISNALNVDRNPNPEHAPPTPATMHSRTLQRYLLKQN